MACDTGGPLVAPGDAQRILAPLKDTLATARKLGCRQIIAQVGNELKDVSRAQQHANCVEAFRAAAPLCEDAVCEREPMMSQKSKRELIEAVRPRYLKANKPGKKRILDEFMACIGYHRKYAIRVLKHGPKTKGLKKPGRKKQYQGAVVEALTRIWEICGRICSKRLKPYLPEMVTVLEHNQELVLAQAVKSQLLQMSRATIDRGLKPVPYWFRSNPERGTNGSTSVTSLAGYQLQDDPLSGQMSKHRANCPFGAR